jgi:hypothetical protein
MEYLYTPRYCYISPLCFTAQRRLEVHDRVRTHVQDARRVANPTGIHRHVDDLLFDFGRLPRVAILQQERTPRTAFFSAPVPLLALPGLAMAHNVGPVTVRTVQDLENHDATRSRWG